jgi:hypothetical protein
MNRFANDVKWRSCKRISLCSLGGVKGLYRQNLVQGWVIIAAILLSAAFGWAEGTHQRGGLMENRFLFVLDTSSAMRSRTNGIAQAVEGLLNSEMDGEFRKGDTIGFWTYDEQINADMPMLVWSEDKKDSIARDLMRFVRHQRYEGRSHLGKVLTAVGKIMEQSDRLTVILLHDGSELIHGTEFDGDINDLQKKYAREFRSAHLPIVTILTARGGTVVDYTINYPSSISIPHTALAVAPPPQTNDLPVVITAAPPVAVPPAPATNALPAEPAPPPRHIEIIMSGTNHLSHEMTPSELAANNPPAAQNNIVMVATPPPQTNAPPATANSSPTAVEAIASNPPPSAPQPEPSAPATAAAPVVAQSVAAPAAVPSPQSTVAASVPAPLPAAAPVPPPDSASLPGAAPAQPFPPAKTQVPEPAPAPAPTRSPAFAAPPPPASAPATIAVVSPGPQVALYIIAFSLLTIAVVLVVFALRRLRADGSPSLISQSIDRGR